MKKDKIVQSWKLQGKALERRVKEAHRIAELIAKNEKVTNEILKSLSPNPKLIILLQEARIALETWKNIFGTDEPIIGITDDLLKRIKEVI